jgi:hypothetical protein
VRAQGTTSPIFPWDTEDHGGTSIRSEGYQ